MLSAQMILGYTRRIGHVSDIGVLIWHVLYCHDTLIISEMRYECPSKLVYMASTVYTRCRHTFETREMCPYIVAGFVYMHYRQV